MFSELQTLKNIPSKISRYNRDRKWKIFLEFFNPDSDLKILDVGFNEEEDNDNENFIEKYYPYPQNLTALGIMEPAEFLNRYPGVNAVKYDGNKFPFKDNEFDVVWSNAVIEHVGNIDKQTLFLNEIKRVSKKSFITTPNRNFPIEVHTYTPLLHILPKNIFDAYLNLCNKPWATGDQLNLLSVKDIRKLLNASKIHDYKIISNHILAFTLDFIIISSHE
jgi:predicted SAM-dependent methyltransferase